jgi:hypothetical protein
MKISRIERLIHVVRGLKVMLDADLAVLYGVPTKSLNLAVKRNASRFPDDFMFVLTKEETNSLRFQFETSKKGRGGRRYLPLAFTEQGVAMLSSVLKSERAVNVNIEIMRVFVRMRSAVLAGNEMAARVNKLERVQGAHERELGEQALEIHSVFVAIRRLGAPKNRRL